MVLKWCHVLICICGISLWGFACQNLCWALCGSDRNYVYKAKTSQLIYIFHLHLHANWLLWNNLSEQEQRTCWNNNDYFKVTTLHLKMIGALHQFSIVLSTLKQLAQFLVVPDFSCIYFLFFFFSYPVPSVSIRRTLSFSLAHFKLQFDIYSVWEWVNFPE